MGFEAVQASHSRPGNESLPGGRRFAIHGGLTMGERPLPPVPSPNELKRLPPLLRRAWYGLNQAFRQRIAHLGITPDQFSILRWLLEHAPIGLTQRELTDLMSSDPNTITSTLSRMEKAGLIARTPHERDRRAHRVIVLDKGRETFANARQIAMALQEQVLSVMPESRRERFLADLELIGNACATALEEMARKAP